MANDRANQQDSLETSEAAQTAPPTEPDHPHPWLSETTPVAGRLLKWLPPGADTTWHASWLELFYDLIFVVAISQLTSLFSEDLSLDGLGKYLFLFLPIFAAWMATNSYNDRFAVDDQVHRLLTFAQMIAVAFMAASITGAMENRSTEFAVSFVAIRLLLIMMYLRIIIGAGRGRRFSELLVGIFAATSLIWIASIFASEPLTFYLWGLALLVDLVGVALPALQRHYGDIPRSLSHRQERFGLFVIIVLGESATGVVAGLFEQIDWNFALIITVIFGMIIIFAIWWIYFGLEAEDPGIIERPSLRVGFWSLGHLPLFMAIGAYGVAIEHAIAEDQTEPLESSVRWLLACSAAVSLLMIVAVRGLQSNLDWVPKIGWPVLLAAGLIILTAALLASVSAVIFVILMAVIVIGLPIIALRKSNRSVGAA